MSKTNNESTKSFYIGAIDAEIEYKAEISRLKDEMDNESIIADIVAENGSKVARIKGKANYPLQFLLNVHRFCLEKQAKVRIKDVKVNFALDSWYHFLKDTDGRVRLSDFKSYEELLQSLWFDYALHSTLDLTAEVVYL